MSGSTIRKSRKLIVTQVIPVLNCESRIKPHTMASDSAADSPGRRSRTSQTQLNKPQASTDKRDVKQLVFGAPQDDERRGMQNADDGERASARGGEERAGQSVGGAGYDCHRRGVRDS